jgi:hypothetical protein
MFFNFVALQFLQTIDNNIALGLAANGYLAERLTRASGSKRASGHAAQKAQGMIENACLFLATFVALMAAWCVCHYAVCVD